MTYNITGLSMAVFAPDLTNESKSIWLRLNQEEVTTNFQLLTNFMDIERIKTDLEATDFQYRLKAITALKAYPAEVVVPILIARLKDPEILVRSFVAMGLGKQQTAASFAALLEMMKFDLNPNVRAEAANSISFFGKAAAPHLSAAFCQDDHWLVRRSILAALVDLQWHNELYEVCIEALAGEDLHLQAAAITALGSLVNSNYQELALEKLLAFVDREPTLLRQKVAYALKPFADPRAKQALNRLRQDANHLVVGAALEELLER
jgi:HEAT repeat protein